MDRRAKKSEKKRKARELAKKASRASGARQLTGLELLARAASREPFGPCFVSAGWDGLESPALVTVLVTRELPSGQLIPGIALVDRTCLGIKDAYMLEPMPRGRIADFADTLGTPHGGMSPCEPLVAQSVVFHAISYARTLGFEPHRSFPAALFGPRPDQLLDTPWHAPVKPIYIPGPHDNAPAILRLLAKAAGPDGFEHVSRFVLDDGDAADDAYEEGALVRSPLECTVTRDEVSLNVYIYRGVSESTWLLEVEDAGGGSTVWDDRFETDQEALDTAMRAIEEEGIESFFVRSDAS